jgi:galactokinase
MALMTAGFAALYGRPPTACADAPGRVNLIGEHTDYNGGLVLPTIIPQRTRAAIAPRSDRTVRATTADLGDGTPAEYRLGAERPGRGWLDYIQGLTQVLAGAGQQPGGFDLRVESDVPVGAGLSSSAALEVAVLRALRSAHALSFDDVELARLAQRAEADFVGARVGMMDQMAASLARAGSALLLDTRSLAYRHVPLPPSLELVVIDSGVAHGHAAGEYNTRRGECEAAAVALGVPFLCALPATDLPRLAGLPPRLARRARHVVTEHARVEAAVGALEAGDMASLGRLLLASHASLRDDFEVSTPELDTLVGLARNEPQVHGARLTGGGFGGAIVILAAAGTGAAIGERIRRRYGERTGREARILVPAVSE